MKKKLLSFFVILLLLFGCSKKEDKFIIEEINKKIENSKNYQLTADLEIYRNEELFTYDVISTYEKEDKFKVELTNKKNNHKQIILKKEEFVYVLTPSLNKSFKFQSDWPYNNSQIYLLQPIILDLKKDKNILFEKKKNNFIFTSLVNYVNEKSFKRQKVYIDKSNNINKIEVVNDNDEIKMTLKNINIEYNKKISKDFFDLEQYNSENSDIDVNNKEKTTSSLENFVYPMYVPQETYLTSQDIIETDEGARVILSFSGNSEFVLIQENLSLKESQKYIQGDPYLILDTIGAVTNKSVSWISEGVEYSIISDTVPIDELITVAQSIGVEPVGK